MFILLNKFSNIITFYDYKTTYTLCIIVSYTSDYYIILTSAVASPGTALLFCR